MTWMHGFAFDKCLAETCCTRSRSIMALPYCIGNVQISRDASGESAQTVKVPSYRRGGWPNHHITFIVAE